MEAIGDEAMIQWQFDMIYRQFVGSKSCVQIREKQQASSLISNKGDDDYDGDDDEDIGDVDSDGGECDDDNGDDESNGDNDDHSANSVDDSNGSDSSKATLLLSDNEHSDNGLERKVFHNLQGSQQDESFYSTQSDKEDGITALNQSGFVSFEGRLSLRKEQPKDVTFIKTSCASEVQLSKTNERQTRLTQHLKHNTCLKTTCASKCPLSEKIGTQLKLPQSSDSKGNTCMKTSCVSRSQLSETNKRQSSLLQHLKDNTYRALPVDSNPRLSGNRRTQASILRFLPEARSVNQHTSKYILCQQDCPEKTDDLFKCDSGIFSGTSLHRTTETVSSSPIRAGAPGNSEETANQRLSGHCAGRAISPVIILDSPSPVKKDDSRGGFSRHSLDPVSDDQCPAYHSADCHPASMGTSDRHRPPGKIKGQTPDCEVTREYDEAIVDDGSVSEAESTHSNASGYCATRRSSTSTQPTSSKIHTSGMKVKVRQRRRLSRTTFRKTRRKHRTCSSRRKPSSCHEPPYIQQRTPCRKSFGSARSTTVLSTPNQHRTIHGKSRDCADSSRTVSTSEERKQVRKSPGSFKNNRSLGTCSYDNKKRQTNKSGSNTAVSSRKTIKVKELRKPSLTSDESHFEGEHFDKTSGRQTRNMILRNRCRRYDNDYNFSERKLGKNQGNKLVKLPSREICLQALTVTSRKRVSLSEKGERKQMNCNATRSETLRHGKKQKKTDSEEHVRKQKRLKKEVKKGLHSQDKTCKPARNYKEQAEKRSSQRIPEKRKCPEDLRSHKRKICPGKSPLHNGSHCPRTTSRMEGSGIVRLGLDSHVADVSMNADDPLHRLSSLENIASTIDLKDMEQLMPPSRLESAQRLVFTSKSSDSLLTVQTFPVGLGQGSLFGPPRHIGAVWKSIMSEK